MGTRSFLGVEQPGRGIDHPPLSSAEVKERVGLYLYSPTGPSWPVLGWTLPVPLEILYTLRLHLIAVFYITAIFVKLPTYSEELYITYVMCEYVHSLSTYQFSYAKLKCFQLISLNYLYQPEIKSEFLHTTTLLFYNVQKICPVHLYIFKMYYHTLLQERKW